MKSHFSFIRFLQLIVCESDLLLRWAPLNAVVDSANWPLKRPKTKYAFGIL